MGQKKKHPIFGILTEFQVFLAHIFVKIGGGCGIRTHVTGTVKQFSRLPRYDRFDNPPCIKTARTVNTELDIQLKDARKLQEIFLARCREIRQKPSHHKGFWIHTK